MLSTTIFTFVIFFAPGQAALRHHSRARVRARSRPASNSVNASASAALSNSLFMNGPLTFGQGRADAFHRFGARDGATAARTGRAGGFVSANAVSPAPPGSSATYLCDAVTGITLRNGKRAVELDQARAADWRCLSRKNVAIPDPQSAKTRR